MARNDLRAWGGGLGGREAQSVKAFLIRLKILNVARLREKKIAETLYKVSTNTAPESFMSVFRRNDEIHQHDTRHASQLVTEMRRLTSSGFSIKFTGPKIWNYLPNTLRNANSLPEFKSKIKSFLMENIELDPNFFYRLFSMFCFINLRLFSFLSPSSSFLFLPYISILDD